MNADRDEAHARLTRLLGPFYNIDGEQIDAETYLVQNSSLDKVIATTDTPTGITVVTGCLGRDLRDNPEPNTPPLIFGTITRWVINEDGKDVWDWGNETCDATKRDAFATHSKTVNDIADGWRPYGYTTVGESTDV